jgi:hypothetical protein
MHLSVPMVLHALVESAQRPASAVARSAVSYMLLLGRSQGHGLALALTLDVPQPLPEPHDSYCVVIGE